MNIKQVLGSIRKVDCAYGLIEDKDRIAIGISGGKDSMLLLHCLTLYRRFSKKSFTLVGIHIDTGYECDLEPIRAYHALLDVPFHVEPTLIRSILKKHLNNGDIDCSLCSKLKKGTLIRVAKELGCNKIALGHNADDAIETLFLNAIYGGKLAVFQPSQYMSRQDILMIRPLIYAFESDILAACQKAHLPIAASGCPKDGFSKRQHVKELLEGIYREYPQAKQNFLLMLHNEKQLALWRSESSIEENAQNE